MTERMGFRCTWMHIASGGCAIGSFWEDRESAEAIARMLRRSPYVTDVEIVRMAASGGGGDER